MKFSVSTAVFNDLPNLKSCVASVRQQDEVSFSHFVQDGDSADGTQEWLGQQADLQWCSENDKGMYDALNRSFDRSDGDILSWLNADEQYLPGTLYRVQSVFDANPDLDMVFGDYILTDVLGEAKALRREIPFRWWYTVNGVLYVHSCALFFRKRVWELYGSFDTSFRFSGDKEWLLRAISGGARIAHIPHFLSTFALTGRNLSRTAEAAEETARVGLLFRASPLCAVGVAARGFRVLEKFLRGCYARQSVSYPFFENDMTSKLITSSVGCRWKSSW